MWTVLRGTAFGSALLVLTCAMSAAQTAKRTVVYACAENQTVTVEYNGEKKAKVTYLDSTYKMKRDTAGDGTPYLTRGMQWWTKGETGFLAGASAKHLIAHDCVAKK